MSSSHSAATRDDADAPFARWMTLLAHHRRGDEVSDSDVDDDEPRAGAARVVDFSKCAFIDVPMVGTHDSATHGICDSSDFAPDAPRGLGRLPRALVPLVRRIVAQWSKTQSMGILQQLRAGVRYFDIRLVPRRCRATGLEELWVSHGSYSVPFASVVHEVAIFYAGVLSGDADAVASNLETIVFDVQRVTGFTAAHTAMFVQAMAPLRALLCEDKWHVSTPLREIWDAGADAPLGAALQPAAGSALPSAQPQPSGASGDGWSIDSWSREVSASNHVVAGGALAAAAAAAAAPGIAGDSGVEPAVALQPVAAVGGGQTTSGGGPTEYPPPRCHQRLASFPFSEHPQSPAWAMSPNSADFGRSGLGASTSQVHSTQSGSPMDLGSVLGGEEAGTPSRRLYASGPLDVGHSPKSRGAEDATGRAHSRVESVSSAHASRDIEQAAPTTSSSSSPPPVPGTAVFPAVQRARTAGGVSQRRIFVLYPAAAIEQSLAVLTPEDRALLHDRHTMAIRSLWFNQQEVTPLMGMLRRELVMSGAAPCERSATLHALQAVLTPTPRDIAWSVVVTLPVRSIQDYAEQLNTNVLALWHGFGRVSRWAPRGEALTNDAAPPAGANGLGIKEGMPSDTLALRDRRNVLLMDFFEVGRAPNGATAVELCFQDAITRFLPELRSPVPVRALAHAGGGSPDLVARLLRLARHSHGAAGPAHSSSLSVDVAPAAVPLLVAPPPQPVVDATTSDVGVEAVPNASPVVGVAQSFPGSAARDSTTGGCTGGKPPGRPVSEGPLSPVDGFTANHHCAHTAPATLNHGGSLGLVRRLWGGTAATFRWMVGADLDAIIHDAPAIGAVAGSNVCTASPTPPQPPAAWAKE